MSVINQHALCGCGVDVGRSGGGASSSPAHVRADSQGTAINPNINVTHRRSSDSDLSITPKGYNTSNFFTIILLSKYV